MVHYRRILSTGDYYFFTVVLKDRKQKFLTENINLLRDTIKKSRAKYNFIICAIVILPEHIHTIWKMADMHCNYSSAWREIKSLFTQALIANGIKLQKNNRGRYNLWQSRFWEHRIRDEQDLERHINYIHYNPVKHGIVINVKDWPFSSFHRYVEKGILPLNWSSNSDDGKNLFGE
ncbi:MAG: transposase [Gammaproteobacteria bacterium]